MTAPAPYRFVGPVEVPEPSTPASPVRSDDARLAASYQPLDAQLTALAGLAPAADQMPYFTGASSASLTAVTAFARTVLDDLDAAAARTTLGAQAADSDLTAIAALAPADGAVLRRIAGAWSTSTMTEIKTALALVKADVGLANVDNTSDLAKPISTATQTALDARQPLDAQLTALAALAPGANQLPYFTGASTAALTDLSAFARTLLDDADATAARATLGAAAAAHTHGVADLTATGTRDATTFLRGDNTWAVPAGGGGLNAVRASDYGWSTSASAATNDAAIAQAITAARAAGRRVYTGWGTYNISVPIDMRATAADPVGVELFGDTRAACIIVQNTASAEVLQIGGFAAFVHDLTLRHTEAAFTASPTTLGAGITLHKAAYFTIARVQLTANGRGIHVPDVDVFEPGTSSGVNNYFHTGNFADVFILRYGVCGIQADNDGDVCTGSSFRNVWIQNRSTGGTQLAPSSRALSLKTCDEMVFDQLNIEDFLGNMPVLLNSCGAITFRSVHFERANLDGGEGQYIRVAGGSHAVIDGITFAFSDIAVSGATGNRRLFSAVSGGKLDVRGVTIKNLSNTAARPTYVVEIDDAASGSTADIRTIGGLSGLTGYTSTAATNPGLLRTGDRLTGNAMPAPLAPLAGLTPAADALPYYTGAAAAAVTTLSAFARTLLDDADAAAARTTLGARAAGAIGGAEVLSTLRTVTAATTLTDTDEVVLADTTSAAFAVTLPTAVGRAGRRYLVKKIGANALTIGTTSSQTIDGVTTETISMTQGFREVVSDGANWRVTGGKVDPVIVALADVAAGGTLTVNAAQATVYRARLTGATATLGVPTQPVDGDVINLELYPTVATSLAINAAIVLTGGITTPIAAGIGKLISLALRYRAATSPATSAAAWRLLAASVDN